MPRSSNPRSLFRMRIRDLDTGRTVYQSIDAKPETVLTKVAQTWVRKRQESSNWRVEIWSRHQHKWRTLHENETVLVDILIQRVSESPLPAEEFPEQPKDPFEEVRIMPKVATPTMSEEEMVKQYRAALSRLQESQVALAGDPDNPELKQKVQFEQRDVTAYANLLGYTPSIDDPTEESES